MHFDVVLSEFIHPCSKKRRRAQFSIHAELTRLSVFVCTSDVCVCTSDVCVCTSDVCVFRQQSRASYMLALCLRAVLMSSPDTWDWRRMHALVVMLRRTLCENVDSAKIKVTFYTTDIDILRVASMHRIVIHCIDIYRWIVTPLGYGPTKKIVISVDIDDYQDKWQIFISFKFKARCLLQNESCRNQTINFP